MSISIQNSTVAPPHTQSSLCLKDLMTLDAAEASAVDLYGQSASVMVAWCALVARSDGREQDYRFWFEVFKRLCGDPATDATLSASVSC